MTTPNIADRLAGVKERQAALGDGRDKRSEAERADYFTAYRAHAETISALMNAPNEVAREQQNLDDLNARRAAFVAKDGEIEQEIATAPDPSTIRDGRERDKEYDRQQQLRQSLQLLRDGRLLRAPGLVYEPLAYLDARIKEVTERRDRAQLALDAAIATAEALLAEEPVTTTSS